MLVVARFAAEFRAFTACPTVQMCPDGADSLRFTPEDGWKAEELRESGQSIWWRKSSQLAAAIVAGAVVFALLPLTGHFDTATLLGLPLSYFLFAVPFPLVIAGAIFWFSDTQHAYDHRFDVND